MSASLVGSEMCIRDSPTPPRGNCHAGASTIPTKVITCNSAPARARQESCLLYTSDAADDM
eukprot:7194638-Alexandrium_andersonii.AAC.1